MLKQPAFDVGPLSSKYNALPGYFPGALIVLTHEVRVLVKNLYKPVGFEAFEVKCGREVRFHLLV